MRKTGRYEQLGMVNYFIPDPLPPRDPSLILDEQLMALYGETMLHLGKLDEMTARLPDKKRFIKSYVIKEALLSSSIEGIHTTMMELFTQPFLENQPNKDTQLVMNYTKALGKALDMIRNENMPIVSRVILNAHKALMQLGQGDKSNPGHYRKQTVKVGNLIPAPPQQISELMSQLEHYINTDETIPTLIKAGLAHVEFEIIHPFLDGNGRIGRLLIVLILIERGILSEPILYPSYYFKKNHFEYYQRLDRVRTHGDFEGWIHFYLKVIKDSSIDAYWRATQIEKLDFEIKTIILNDKRFIKMYDTMVKALTIIFNYPIININQLSLQLEVSYNTANKIITHFVRLGVLVAQTKQKRGKLFRFKKYLEILEQECPEKLLK